MGLSIYAINPFIPEAATKSYADDISILKYCYKKYLRERYESEPFMQQLS